MFRLSWNSRAAFGDTFDAIAGKTVTLDYAEFPLHRYGDVTKALDGFCQKKGFKLELTPLPNYVLESFKTSGFGVIGETAKREKIDAFMAKLPKTIRETLHDFQKETLLFADIKNGRILIGDEMGLGKTIQAIALCALYKEDWPVLVVAPSALKENWRFEMARWLPEHLGQNRIVIASSFTSDQKPRAGEFDVCIASYSIAAKSSDEIKKLKFNMVILDECHMLKSKEAQRSKKILPIVQKAKRRILLSGTATPNRPIELYNQLQCLLPPKTSAKMWFMGKSQYSIRYCDGHKEQKGRFTVWNEKGHSNLTELNIMLNRDVMIRRLKKDALPDLKPKIRKIYRLSAALRPPAELAAAYSKFDERQVARIFDGVLRQAPGDELAADGRPKLAFASAARRRDFAQLYRDSGLAKVRAVCALLARKAARGRKTIVFAHHRAVLDEVERFLLRAEVAFVRIDGRVPAAKRFELVAQFQKFDFCRVALLSISASGVGITLTSAERVIFAELDFVPARLLQCEDRAHRIGQKKTIKVYYILARKTLDDFVWPLIQRKLQTVASTLDGVKKGMMVINSSTNYGNSSVIKEKSLDKKIELRQTKIDFSEI